MVNLNTMTTCCLVPWLTPVYDRTSSSYYNFGDTNRVADNNIHLAHYALYYLLIDPTLAGYTVKYKDSLPTIGTINRLENSINSLKDTVIGSNPVGWITLNENWVGDTYSFVYTNANNLEKNQEILLSYFYKIYQSQRYCGTYICGETWGNLFNEYGLQ